MKKNKLQSKKIHGTLISREAMKKIVGGTIYPCNSKVTCTASCPNGTSVTCYGYNGIGCSAVDGRGCAGNDCNGTGYYNPC